MSQKKTFCAVGGHADCVSFVPTLVEAFKGFKPGKADIVFVSSDRSEDLQRRYMEEGVYVEVCSIYVIKCYYYY